MKLTPYFYCEHDSGQKPVLQQNYTQIDRDKQGKEILKFVKSLHHFYLYEETNFHERNQLPL